MNHIMRPKFWGAGHERVGDFDGGERYVAAGRVPAGRELRGEGGRLSRSNMMPRYVSSGGREAGL